MIVPLYTQTGASRINSDSLTFDAVTLTLLSSASRLKFISVILSNVALRKENEINEKYKSKLKDYFNRLYSKIDCHNLLDVFIMLTKLLIVEAKLIHKICGHLLDLVIREGLRWGGDKIIINLFAGSRHVMCCSFHLSHLLERQVIGEGALHVIVLTGGMHVVGADLWDIYNG